MAEVAAIGGDPGLMSVQRRFVVGEIPGIGFGWQATRNDAGRQRAVRHGTSGPPLCLFSGRLAQVNFFIKW